MECKFPFILFSVLILLLSFNGPDAANYTASVTGNWSNSATWGGAGVPGPGDNATINGGITVTADGTDACNNLTIGNATSGNTIVQITSSSNSLTINGALSINPNNINKNYTLNAGGGTISISGTFAWGTGGTNTVEASTGTVTFAPAVTIANSNQTVVLTGAGIINFNSSFTDNFNKLVPATGGTINFASNYTVSTTTASWAAKGTAVFSGTGTITANSSLTLNNVQTAASASTNLASAGGTAVIGGALTLGSGSTFTANENFELDGNLTNNGGTFNGGSNTIYLNGTNTISSSASMTFPYIQIGLLTTTTTVSVTLSSNVTCPGLTFTGYNRARTVTITTGDSLTVNGNVLINQPASANTNSLSVNGGTCILNGNLTFTGTASTASYISKVAVTTGVLNLTSNVSFDANTVAANQVITLTSTGTINISNPLILSYGTLSSTSTGTINFNGSAPSFTFGGSNNPAFSITGNTGLNFANGFTNNTNTLTTVAAGSTSYFSGTASITANAAITFGNVQLNSGSAITLTGNIGVGGSWTNNGGTFSGGSNTVSLIANGGTIGGTSSTTFPIIQVGNGAGTAAYTMNNTNSCTAMTFYAGTLANTFTLADTLIVNGNVTINQPTAAVTNSLVVNASICTITGNLSLSGTVTTASYLSKVSVTTGSLTVSGTVSYAADATAANQVITLTSTGNITFNSPLSMAYGTLSTTNTGTLNFNGSSPSFTFGGSSSPVFTTTNSGTINFANGFINNTNAYTFAAGSNTYFTGAGTIVANAGITFGNLQINASDTLASTGNVVDIAGNCTLASGSALKALQNFELTGNWTNSGGTMTGSNDTLILIGGAKTISGSSPTTFPAIQLGNATSPAVSYTMNNNNSCSALIFYGGGVANTFTLGSGDSLTVNGNLTINQPTAAVTNNLLVNTGICTVTGNLNLLGTVTAASYIAKVTVTTGSFTVNGSVNWGSNSTAADQVVTVTTGTITFNSSMTMASGTLSVTSTGIINFNGSSSPSFNFGGGNAPVLTTTSGSILEFKNGFTNNANALTLTAGSSAYFTGSGAITPNANITFANVQLDSLAFDTLNAALDTGIVAGSFTLLHGSNINAKQALEVRGDWINNGGTISSASNAIMMNGSGQTIGGSSSTIFPILQIGNTSVATTVTCTIDANITCDSLVFNGYTNARTLTLSSGITLTVSGNLNINQPTAAKTNELAVNAGACTVSGNLNFIGTTSTNSHVAKVAVTTGSFSLIGNVNWMSNTTVATEVISVTTGTLTFASSLTMGTGSGTLSVTGAATVNFNGATSPSFNFGGSATSPAFTTAAGCTLNFQHGFTNNFKALTLAATSKSYFTGNGSITPNFAITFGSITINASDTLVSGGAVIAAGNFTLNSGTLFYANENFEVRGNWTNNNGTLSGTTYTVFLNGTAQTVSGNATTFQTLEIGNSTTAVNVAATMNCNNTCSALIIQAGTHNRTLTLGSGITLAVSGNLTLSQPTANNMTGLLEVGSGTCNVSGNLIFTGTNTAVTRINKIDVTSGSFTLGGSVTWAGNTVVGDEVISVNTGTATFSSSLSMGTKSGTMQVTGAGTINFNGTTAPSFTFGGATAPVFNTASGCKINIKNGMTTATSPLTFASGSNVIFTGTGTITPAATVTFGNIQISSGSTLTSAGSFYVGGNWKDSGTYVPATYGVTFNGSGTQTIFSNSGTETFYQLSASTSGATVQLLNNIMVTNAFIMSGANININNYTLTLGNNAGANLSYIGGIAYGGIWKRWFPASAITDSSGAYYGLFPIGTSTDYRYVDINSTTNPANAGYISASHTNVNGGIAVHYTDNEGSLIQEIGAMHTDLSTSGSGLAGGTYNIQVHFTGFSTSGNVADLKLETYTGSVMGSCGTFVVPAGPVNTPTVGRTGITDVNLANSWVIGTDNEATTPLYAFYTSRKTGNWNDVTPGNGTWSLSSDTTASSCNCVPISGSYVVIDSTNTVTANTTDSVDFIDIMGGGALINNSSCTFLVVGNMTVYGTGTFTNHGTLLVGGDLRLPSGNSVTSSGNVTVTYDLTVPSGCTYTQSDGTLTLNGNVTDSGTVIATSTGTIKMNGNAATINGNGTINDSLGTITITNNKTIASGTSLTIGTSSASTNLTLATATTVNNDGTITLNGNLAGATASSNWINNANSILNATGTVMDTGSLDAATGPNTVNYSGSGTQTITAPATSYYNLSATNAGTKSITAAMLVTNALTLGGSTILNESTNVVSGNASLTMTGTSQLQLQRSVAGVYPELTGIYSLSNGTVVINQTGDSAVVTAGIYNNLTLNGNTSYDISGIENISNNLYMQSSATLNNNDALAIGGIFTYSSSGYTTLQDNITASEIILNSGTLDDGGLNITISGTGWYMNGGTFNSSGQTTFTGNLVEYIGGSTATTFNNLVINSTTDVILNLSPAAPTVVNGNLNLLTGNLVTNSTNILRMLDTSTVSNASASSYVSGPMVKVGAGTFVFPIGKDGYLGEVGVSEIIDSTTEVTAEYFDIGNSTLTPVNSSLTQVSQYEYWNITRAVTSDPVQVQLFWTNSLRSHVISCSYLTVAQYTGGQWINDPSATVGGSVCGGGGSGSAQTTGTVSAFGYFTFGSSEGGEALPVQLVSFNASPDKNVVLTKWRTDLEINNAYFTVERSGDAENFTPIGTVKGSGNSTTVVNYEFTDENPLPGVSYYRLRQTDYNSNSSLSNIVSVSFAGQSSLLVYPNPATDQVFINIVNPGGEILINIYDMSGRLMFEKTVSANEGSSNQIISLATAGVLASGVYLISATSNLEEYNQKLIIR